jgi:putative LysE/RhtB family amino acid efflux pump
MLAALTTGLVLGFLVAAQVGPMWLFCARSTLRSGLLTGLAIGAGVATVDAAYAALGALGAAGILLAGGIRVGLGLAGAAVLVALGARTLWSALRIRAGAEAPAEVGSPLRAFRTAVVATASNPSTIASWAAIFTAASAAGLGRSPAGATLLVAGVAAGSMAWHAVLAAGMSVLRRRASLRALRIADGLAGTGLIGFGGVLAWRALRD